MKYKPGNYQHTRAKAGRIPALLLMRSRLNGGSSDLFINLRGKSAKPLED
jgi:hypothetical protein